MNGWLLRRLVISQDRAGMVIVDHWLREWMWVGDEMLRGKGGEDAAN